MPTRIRRGCMSEGLGLLKNPRVSEGCVRWVAKCFGDNFVSVKDCRNKIVAGIADDEPRE
jgi:hypothetical protein